MLTDLTIRLLNVAIALCLISTAAADTYTVKNTNNSGPDSLRQAITDANAHANIDVNTPDRISFNIPNSDPNRNATTGVFTITPSFPGLPSISDPVVIDGYTQPGSSANTLSVGDNAVLLIELSGTSADSGFGGTSGLDISTSGGGSTIRGLIINRFISSTINFSPGIRISANNVQVQGNFIGTNSAGTTALGNDVGIATSGGFGGVGGGNQIGTPAPADRNLISGNGNGISLQNAATAANTVQGNYIGVTASGNGNLGNSNIGILINATQNQGTAQGVTVIGGTTSSPGTGAGNVISGNVTDGIRFSVPNGGVLGPVTIQGNIIGLGIDGTTAVGNGIGIEDKTSTGSTIGALLIGGTSATMRNIISKNGDGILYASTNTTVQGNFIGTDITGTLARGNAVFGFEIPGDHRDGNNSAATTITIGGTAAGDGNLISGNGQGGIDIRNANGVIQGNRIGTQADGASPLGNGGDGIRAWSFGLPLQIMVGGTANGAGNVIAYSGAAGVSIGASSVTVLRNSIFSNGPTTPNNFAGLGIDLEPTGPQANHIGAATTGPNGGQNYPLLTSISSSGGTASIFGTLNSVPNQTYRIEFFANDALDPSGYGEGKNFAGATDVTTDANGNASFNFNVPQIAGIGRVTSTATDPNGNTSEFSPSIGQLLNISTRMRVQTGDNVLIGGFIITGTDPKRVILRGIGPSLSNSGVPDPLADPTLELHDASGTTIASNDNWKDLQQAEIQATGIAPRNDLESAIVTTLAANNSGYTAIVRGKDNITGIGLVEVYDLDQGANSRLANISTRGFVQTGDNAMIGGYIIGGGTAKVIVRAIGPSLPVGGKLADPTLELHDRSGALIGSNDNWRSTQEAEIIATTIPPSNDLESAIVVTLLPAPYTAIVRGKNSTTGVGLVEVYNLQ